VQTKSSILPIVSIFLIILFYIIEKKKGNVPIKVQQSHVQQQAVPSAVPSMMNGIKPPTSTIIQTPIPVAPASSSTPKSKQITSIFVISFYYSI
jgi:hypothetical protein